MSLAQELLTPLLNDAHALAEQGFATPADIDTAMRLGAGHPKGPLEILGEVAPPAVTATAGEAEQPVRAAVVGTGTMATGIAEVLARAGTDTVIVGRSSERAESVVRRIGDRLERAVERGKLSPEERTAIAGHLAGEDDLTAAAGVDLVIEAVTEQLDVKRQLFAALETVAPGVPLATNTSSFRVDEVNTRVSARERVLALHFFNPAPAMRLVEVVGGSESDPELVARGHAWARGIGKVTVSCRDESGFLVNRLLVPYLNDAVRTCAVAGVTWVAADTSVREELGHPMGPFELMDLIGLDVMVLALETMQHGFGEDRYAPSAPLRELAAQGRLGRKTGGGFHDYGNGR